MNVAIVDQALARVKRMKRSILTGARLLHADATSGGTRTRAWMVTLTYKPECEWDVRDITKVCKNFRDYCEVTGTPCRYVWKLELQKRGVVHYHIMLWLPYRKLCPKFDAKGWWPYGMTNRKAVYAGTKYMAKYCSKGVGEGRIPKGARIHGNGGVSRYGRNQLRWWNAPSYVRQNFECGAPIKRVLGGFVDTATGIFKESEYVFVRSHGGMAYLVHRSMVGKISFNWKPQAASGSTSLTAVLSKGI